MFIIRDHMSIMSCVFCFVGLCPVSFVPSFSSVSELSILDLTFDFYNVYLYVMLLWGHEPTSVMVSLCWEINDLNHTDPS
jgi:hypothetical protein